MSFEWPLKKISEIADFLNSKRIPLKSLDRQKRQGPYPYYGASGIVDSIDEYIFDGTYLLISEDGENLRTRKTPIAFKAHGKFWVNNHAHIISEKEEGVLDYLEYYFSTLDLDPYITGAVQPKLNKANLDSIEIPFPDKDTRLFINSTLNSLTQKVAINHKLNQTLEQMAQTLFKSWFVDFEPVKAKIAVLEAGGSQEDATIAAMTAISGKDADALAVFEREHPEQYAEIKATAELFPSAMQESDQGFIPEGWEYRKIGDYIDNISKTYPLKKVEQVVFLNTGDIKEGIFLHQNKSDVGSLPGQAKKSIREGDILYSEIRPVNKRFAFVYFNADEYVVSTKLMVLRPKSKELSYYLYFLLSSNEVVSYLQLMAESRSGTFPQITYDTVSDVKILTSPDESVIKSFCKFLGENLFIPQQSIIKQNDMLTNIRDTLLPKLLSGEINLPEAEQAVSEAENV
ncbi:restriction endonuclease subunit S [Enterobacter sp. HK169]|uniref:restriction endonuclease subunit S n=1 Tax=Enterobacter sp. HK169 TaxID=1868135 RepID=UPI002F42D772